LTKFKFSQLACRDDIQLAKAYHKILQQIT